MFFIRVRRGKAISIKLDKGFTDLQCAVDFALKKFRRFSICNENGVPFASFENRKCVFATQHLTD